MDKHKNFEKINTTMNLATNCSDNVLGGAVILSAVFTEFCLADLICAEADKIERALENNSSTAALADLDRSVSDVLDKVCCIEMQINRKIEQGRLIREGSNVAG